MNNFNPYVKVVEQKKNETKSFPAEHTIYTFHLLMQAPSHSFCLSYLVALIAADELTPCTIFVAICIITSSCQDYQACDQLVKISQLELSIHCVTRSYTNLGR